MTRLIDADKLLKIENVHGGEWNGLGISKEYVYVKDIQNAPTVEPKQEELTLEKAIDFLTETGWLPNHDRELTEPKQGEWKRISMDKYIRHASYFYRCSVCGEDTIGETNFCPNCGADMSANDRQVTGKLNSEIEKSKSEICPCIECCALDNSEPCRKGCSDYQKWKEGEAE